MTHAGHTQGHPHPVRTHRAPYAAIAGGVLFVAVLAGLFVYGYMRAVAIEARIAALNAEFASTTAALADGIAALDRRAVALSDTLLTAEQRIEFARQNLEMVQTRIGGFEYTVGQISGTVNTLEKLSKTDAELLQKYSKVYFLNEHFVPDRLADIDAAYLYSEQRPERIHASVWPKLKALLDAAKASGETLFIKSAYRSFDEQQALKTTFSVTYGAGTANTFSADQGYSEHQLGTTVDFISSGQNGQLDGFDRTSAYTWLRTNAHRYGFVLSYPPNNAYYVFEPWHWRYVGVELATRLFWEKKNFYDMEQRVIDEYLVKVFD